MERVADKVDYLFTPYGSKNAQYITRKYGRVAHSETGREALPIAALVAAHWLMDRETSEAVLPPSRSKFLPHGTWLACIQTCLNRQKSTAEIGRALGLTTNFAARHCSRLVDNGMLVNVGKPKYAVFTVAPHIRAVVANMASELHSLQNETYANKLRTTVVEQIVGRPELYGSLAHAALMGLAETRRESRPAPMD